MFHTKVIQKIKTHLTFNNFFSTNVLFIRNVEKYVRAGKVTGNINTVFPQDIGIQSLLTQ